MEHDYLVHHGIEGQKWGVSNGPPYPLNASSYSSKERKLNPDLVKKKLDEKKKLREAKANQRYKVKLEKAKQKEALSQVKANTAKNNRDAKIAKEESKNIKDTVSANKVLASPSDVYKQRSNMSDKELNDYLNRYRMESQLAQMAKQQYESEHKAQTFIKKQGEKVVNRLMDNAINKGFEIIKDYTTPDVTYDLLDANAVLAKSNSMTTKELQDYISRASSINKITEMAEKEKNKK